MRWVLVLLALALVLPVQTMAANGPGEGKQGSEDDHPSERSGPPDRAARDGHNGSANEDEATSRGPPAWRSTGGDERSPSLPYTVDGRFISFVLTSEGVRNLTVHGRAFANIDLHIATIDDVERQGTKWTIEAEGTEIEVRDVAKVRLRIAAADIHTTLPAATELPSGATVRVSVDDDGLRLEADPPRASLGRGPPTTLAPATIEVERGERPALAARAGQDRMGIAATTPHVLETRFQGAVNGTAGAVAVDLALTRALLVQDLDGDGRPSIGEPALAAQVLEDGTATIVGETLVTRFPLWAGNLTVVAELDARQVKVTYHVEDLQAPPGTLFVLESALEGVAGAALRPTSRGVQATNGSVVADWDVGGPVTIDGEPAWAHHTVIQHNDGRVFVLLAYPAGDAIVHDPTLSVQSVGGALQGFASASPLAILVGALAATAVVGTSIYVRRPR